MTTLPQKLAELRALSDALDKLTIRRRDGTARQPPKIVKEAAAAIRDLLDVVEAAQTTQFRLARAAHDLWAREYLNTLLTDIANDLEVALSNLARNL